MKIGDIFYNAANIYFDYNPPIETNTASTEIIEKIIMSNEDLKAEKLSVYPNPTKEILYISIKNEIQKVEIYDLMGNKLLEQSSTKKINVSRLTNGIYSIVIKVNNSVHTSNL